MKSSYQNFEDYINKHSEWKKELTTLVKIIRRSKFDEGIKWGSPTFMLNGKNVLGFRGFKNHFAIWYFNGALLKDPAKKLINAQTGKTVGMRQWRFESMADIDAKLIHQYNQEAIANEKAGKKVLMPRKKVVPMPVELKEYLGKNKNVANAYEKFSPGRQNEIKEYIGEAKREATRLTRLEKCIPMILAGVSPNDKYKRK